MCKINVIDGLEKFIEIIFKQTTNPNTVRTYSRAAKVFVAYLVDRYGKTNTSGDITDIPLLEEIDAVAYDEFTSWMNHNHCFPQHMGRPKGSTKKAVPLPLEKEIGLLVVEMRKTNGKPYSDNSRKLYDLIARRLLEFWRVRGWITFTKEEEIRVKKPSEITSKKLNRGSNRAKRTPADLGRRLIDTVKAMDLSHVTGSDRASKAYRLEVLRKRCLITLLTNTALRAGDLSRIERTHIENARRNGTFNIDMEKTGKTASSRMFPATIAEIDAYLAERNDYSPWILIQHGPYGVPPKKPKSVSDYYTKTRGYGMKLSRTTIWKIVSDVSQEAGFDPEENFVSPHGVRHWHAQALRYLGKPIDQIQAVLGHSSPDVTEKVYASKPSIDVIGEAQAIILGFDDKDYENNQEEKTV